MSDDIGFYSYGRIPAQAFKTLVHLIEFTCAISQFQTPICDI